MSPLRARLTLRRGLMIACAGASLLIVARLRPEHQLPAIVCVDGTLIVAMAVLADRNRRRRSRLTCACGYDLRASPVRCPECGRFATPQPPYVKGDW